MSQGFVDVRHWIRSGPFTFSLEPEFCFRHDYLDVEDLVSIADQTVDSELEEIFDIHLKTCGSCRENLSPRFSRADLPIVDGLENESS